MRRAVCVEESADLPLGLEDHHQPAPEQEDLHVLHPARAQAADHFGPDAAVVLEIRRDERGIIP
jgi:hypothetical protein